MAKAASFRIFCWGTASIHHSPLPTNVQLGSQVGYQNHCTTKIEANECGEVETKSSKNNQARKFYLGFRLTSSKQPIG